MENSYSNEQKETQQESFQNSYIKGGKKGIERKSFKDNRPEALEQRKMQEQIRSGGRTKMTELQPKQNEAVETVPPLTAGKVNNTGLPDDLKDGIERLSGYSMDDVKVHYNSDKPEQLNALAYAEGTDIYIGPGQEKHLAHEAWHVVQQKQGRVAQTMQLKGGIAVNDDNGLEKEADVMGKKAIQPTITNEDETLEEKSTGKESVLQMAGYAQNNKDEKDHVLNILKDRKIAGMSDNAKDYTWHHLYPKSEWKAIENFRSFIALGPEPKYRLDDPGNTGIDPNYINHKDNPDPESKVSIVDGLSEKLVEAAKKDGKKLPNSFDHGESKDKQKGPDKIRAIKSEDVMADWSQWYIPYKLSKKLFEGSAMKSHFESDGYKKSRTDKFEDSNYELNAGNFDKAINELTQKLERTLTKYKTYYKDRGDDSSYTKDGYNGNREFVNVDKDKDIEAVDEIGIPLVELFEANETLFDKVYSSDTKKDDPEDPEKKLKINELWFFIDAYLKTKRKWLARGSRGNYLNDKELEDLRIKEEKEKEEKEKAYKDNFIERLENGNITIDDFSEDTLQKPFRKIYKEIYLKNLKNKLENGPYSKKFNLDKLAEELGESIENFDTKIKNYLKENEVKNEEVLDGSSEENVYDMESVFKSIEPKDNKYIYIYEEILNGGNCKKSVSKIFANFFRRNSKIFPNEEILDFKNKNWIKKSYEKFLKEIETIDSEELLKYI